jgi:hypothetical protein
MLNKLAWSAMTVAFMGCATAPPPNREVSLESWAEHHPEASKELGLWVREHAQAAALFFDWDGHHAAQSQEFVTWAISHPGEPIEAFTGTHPRWDRFDRIMESHRPAAEAFLGWCRRHPDAAEALMHHPGGLEWAGHHLYAADWHMETGS